jgi:hypothetical protein
VKAWLRSSARCAAVACAVALAGCIPSNVVAVDQRMVVADLGQLQFAPAPALQLAGLYESVAITGDAAVALRKVYYLFVDDGTYTAAALAEIDGKPAFQTLSGTWSSTASGLSLDGAEPVVLEQAPEHLRITAPNGALVLRWSPLQ